MTYDGVVWISSKPAIASVGGSSTTANVTGVAAGNATVTATARIRYSWGYSTCTTDGGVGNSSPDQITVIPKSYFQTYGEDVTAGGQVSDTNPPSGAYVSEN